MADKPTVRKNNRSLYRLFLRPGTFVLVALSIAATAIVPSIISELPHLSFRSEYRLTRDAVVVTPGPPDWVPEAFLTQIIDGELWPVEGTSMLEETLVGQIAGAFAAHPWVAEVVRVERRFPARVMVKVKYRRPVAWIEVPGQSIPVDVTGVCLPKEDLAVSDSSRYPLVRGVVSQPPSQVGVAWDDPGLLAAARLARELGPHWESFGLSAIVVQRRDEEPAVDDRVFLQMLTRGGSRVVWGRPPGTRHPGELTVAQKLGRLKQFISYFDSLDPPQGPYEINIRHWREIIYRRLGSESAQRMRLPVIR
jgi:hypothetical protein